MSQIARFPKLFWAPDQQPSWNENPGVLTSINNYVPTSRGTYSNVGQGTWFGTTLASASKPFIGYIFTGVSGSNRVLIGTQNDIDEYNFIGTRTNRGTGYATGNFSMAALGDSIIATNGTDAVQVSTGAGFAALGGSPPKARIAVTNNNFLLLFDCDDGASFVYKDGWVCSGLQNLTSWTTGAANLSTGANNGRLLQAQGPIRAASALRDMIVVFKDNAIIVGQYTANPYTFSWRLVSARVGCSAKHGVVEHAGCLYFYHTTGFWSFDGASLRPIGQGIVDNYMLTMMGVSNGYLGGGGGDFTATQTTYDETNNNVVWLFTVADVSWVSSQHYFMFYNLDSGMWGACIGIKNSERTSSSDSCALIKCTFPQMLNFNSQVQARIPFLKYLYNSGADTVQARYLSYGTSTAGTNMDAATFTTGLWGSRGRFQRVKKIYLDCVSARDPSSSATLTLTASKSEYGTGDVNTAAGTWNSTTRAHDINTDGAIFELSSSVAENVACEVSSISIESDGTGKV